LMSIEACTTSLFQESVLDLSVMKQIHLKWKGSAPQIGELII